MGWLPDKSRPICPQICEQICLKIADGTFAPHERLPSVRDIATSLGVNPNTVQHAMDQLDQQRVVFAVRGSGWYVREDISVAKQVLQEMRKKKAEAFFAEMQALGLSFEETKKFIEEWSCE